MSTYQTSCSQCHGLCKIHEATTIICQRCQGTGKFTDLFGNTHDTIDGPLLCYRCGGRKQIITNVEKPCNHCHETGYIHRETPPLVSTTIKFTVHLIDKAGTTVALDLKTVMNDELGDYLSEFIGDDIYIDTFEVTEIPNNNTIICTIIHDNTNDDLLRCIRDYIKDDAPYSDFLTLFYEDPEQNYFSLVMDEVTVEEPLLTIKNALDDPILYKLIL